MPKYYDFKVVGYYLVFASRYALHMSDKEQLIAQIPNKQWIYCGNKAASVPHR